MKIFIVYKINEDESKFPVEKFENLEDADFFKNSQTEGSYSIEVHEGSSDTIINQ